MPTSRTSRFATIWIAAAVGIVSSGCSDELPQIGALVYEGADFDVWASDGLVACGGTHAYTEAWLAAFRRRLGDEARPTHHRFYWVGPDDADEVPCRDDNPACAFTSRSPKTIYSPVIPLEHEIVHVELAHLVGPPLLTEGAAEIYGSVDAANSIAVFPVEELVDGDSIPALGYPSAGRFSRYLVDSQGDAAYFDLLRAARPTHDERGLRAAFESALDISLDDAIADYEEFAACDPPRWRYHDYECSDLPITEWRTEDLWQDSIALDCARDDVLGPRPADFEGPIDLIWTLRALEIPEGAPYRLSLVSSEPATATLEPCFAQCFDGEGSPSSPLATVEHPAVTVLEPGRYWLRVEHPASSDADVTVTLEHADGE